MPTEAINRVFITTTGGKVGPLQMTNAQLSILVGATNRESPMLLAFGKTMVRPSSITALDVSNV